jgi:hypothetical protein
VVERIGEPVLQYLVHWNLRNILMKGLNSLPIFSGHGGKDWGTGAPVPGPLKLQEYLNERTNLNTYFFQDVEERIEEPVLQYLVPRGVWFASELGNSTYNNSAKLLFTTESVMKGFERQWLLTVSESWNIWNSNLP